MLPMFFFPMIPYMVAIADILQLLASLLLLAFLLLLPSPTFTSGLSC
jgi:hypothetical protein